MFHKHFEDLKYSNKFIVRTITGEASEEWNRNGMKLIGI
jgi:hypothetical protein